MIIHISIQLRVHVCMFRCEPEVHIEPMGSARTERILMRLVGDKMGRRLQFDGIHVIGLLCPLLHVSY